MLKIKSLVLLTVWLLSISAYAAIGGSSVWKVSNGQQEVYIGGTIHLLSDSDYPLPKAFDWAYAKADTLVFEVDISQTKTPQFGQMMMAASTYRDGRTLKQVLSPKVYRTLADFLSGRGGNIASLEPFKPGMLSVLLTLEELARLGQVGQGVDDFYNQKALSDKKGLVYLETIEQQLDFLANMGDGKEDEVILQTISDIKELETSMADLKSAWRKGDNQELMAVALAPWKDEFPKTYQSIVVDRNNAWMPEIEQMLKTPDVEYVLVGALHLVGPDGLLAQLRARGYRIEQLVQ